MNEHPDFEDLSAFVDGEAPQWLDHVDSCPACRTDVDRLRAVIAAVGLPVPPVADEVREQALSVALDALTPPAVAVTESSAVDTPRVRPLRVTTASPPPVVAPPLPRRRGNGPWVALGSVAAVLLTFVVGASVLRSGGGGNDSQTLASGAPDAAEKATAAPGYDLRQAAGAGAGGVTADDLGPVDDPAQLAAKAGGARAAEGLVASGNAPSAPAPAAAAAPGGATVQDSSGLARAAVGTRPCEEQVRTARPQLGQVVYFATATSQGRPVYVLGFAAGSEPSPVTLLAVAREGCAVLVEAALP